MNTRYTRLSNHVPKMTNLTSLTRFGYGVQKDSISASMMQELKTELTVKPYIPKDYQIDNNVKPYKMFQESERMLYLPRWFGVERFGLPGDIRVHNGTPWDSRVEFVGELREKQKEVCEKYMEAVTEHGDHGGGGILNLPCGFGKTVLALYLASKIRKKTLIIVHKDFLLQQWRERIGLFLKNARVGLIKAAVTDVEDKDIVLASLQSLSMKEYEHGQVLGEFGMLIVDECHHTSAEVFSKALKKTCFKYTLGLSATLQRKDGLSRVFKWFLGKVLYKFKSTAESLGEVCVQMRQYYRPDPRYSQEWYMMGSKLNVSRMINQICAYEPRTKFIAELVKEALRKEPTRRVLILSDRREHLNSLAHALGDDTKCGFYQGGLSQDVLKQSEKQQIILGTFQFVSEGFDVPGLDTLVLASPKSDVIQAVGRILREKPECRKNVPLIIDIVDRFSIFEQQGTKRRKYYSSQKFECTSDVKGQAEFNADVTAIAKALAGKCCIIDENEN